MRKPSGSAGGSSSPPAGLHWSQGIPAPPQLHSRYGRSGWASHTHGVQLYLGQGWAGVVSVLSIAAANYATALSHLVHVFAVVLDVALVCRNGRRGERFAS